jgi:hypothetical protein
MPTLEFKGKPFVYSHHLSVPFRELVVDPKKSLPVKGQKPSLNDNLIIHGDNLEALKALLPRYAGKVDVIYIDPPYNSEGELDEMRRELFRRITARMARDDEAPQTPLPVRARIPSARATLPRKGGGEESALPRPAPQPRIRRC